MIAKAVERIVVARSGGMCELCGAHMLEDDKMIGELAHIRGNRPGSARYDPGMSESQKNSPENLILLCPTCHTQIDRRPGKYMAARLREMRQRHTDRLERVVGIAMPDIEFPELDDIPVPKSENECNEFKETFAVPVAGGNANNLKLEVAISVAAFANTEGGRLFVGVRDDGTPTGLKWDLKQYKKPDKLELAIRDYLKSKLGRPMGDVRFRFKGDVYLVIVIPKLKMDDWVYIEGDFYVRDGNRSQKLNSQETAEYQRTH